MRTARLFGGVFVFALMTIAVYAQCPAISVIGPPGITMPGERMIFRVDGGTSDLRYAWSVSHGTIIEGQGTPAITVATDKTMFGVNVTAKVEISGLPSNCATTASEFAPTVRKLEWESLDEWKGDLKLNDQRGRLDNFFADLSYNPTHTGLVILRVPEKERRDAKNRRLRLVVDHARWRKFDLKRIWFCFETFFEPRIVIYRFDPGVLEGIKCEMILKGGEIQ